MGKPRIILRPTSMLRKQAGQMKKLLGLWEKNNKSDGVLSGQGASAPPSQIDGKPRFLDAIHGINQSHITRRQIVLNRHFTEIISDVLSNNLKRQLTDIGVTIKSIETKAWNKGVGVFYYTNKPFDPSIHQELSSLITSLRAAITERRLIGRTPMINFVYDKSAETEQSLEEAIKLSKISEPEETRSLVQTSSNQIHFYKAGFGEREAGFNAKRFSAPDGMSNMMLGLNYSSLYDEVAMKLERGRGQSARMPSNVSLASFGPFIRVPSEGDSEELDATERIIKMKNFLVSQKKKSEYQAKLRRQQELCARDRYKWDLPEQSGEDEPKEVEDLKEELEYD